MKNQFSGKSNTKQLNFNIPTYNQKAELSVLVSPNLAAPWLSYANKEIDNLEIISKLQGPQMDMKKVLQPTKDIRILLDIFQGKKKITIYTEPSAKNLEYADGIVRYSLNSGGNLREFYQKNGTSWVNLKNYGKVKPYDKFPNVLYPSSPQQLTVKGSMYSGYMREQSQKILGSKNQLRFRYEWEETDGLIQDEFSKGWSETQHALDPTNPKYALLKIYLIKVCKYGVFLKLHDFTYDEEKDSINPAEFGFEIDFTDPDWITTLPGRGITRFLTETDMNAFYDNSGFFPEQGWVFDVRPTRFSSGTFNFSIYSILNTCHFNFEKTMLYRINLFVQDIYPVPGVLPIILVSIEKLLEGVPASTQTYFPSGSAASGFSVPDYATEKLKEITFSETGLTTPGGVAPLYVYQSGTSIRLIANATPSIMTLTADDFAFLQARCEFQSILSFNLDVEMDQDGGETTISSLTSATAKDVTINNPDGITTSPGREIILTGNIQARPGGGASSPEPNFGYNSIAIPMWDRETFMKTGTTFGGSSLEQFKLRYYTGTTNEAPYFESSTVDHPTRYWYYYDERLSPTRYASFLGGISGSKLEFAGDLISPAVIDDLYLSTRQSTVDIKIGHIANTVARFTGGFSLGKASYALIRADYIINYVNTDMLTYPTDNLINFSFIGIA